MRKIFFIILMFMLILPLTLGALSDDQYLYYTLDAATKSGNSAGDATPNDRDGTFTNTGGITNISAGKIAEGINFNTAGTSYLSPSVQVSLNNFTVDFWFQKNDTIDDDYTSFFKFEGPNGYIRIFEYGTDEIVQFVYKIAEGSSCTYTLTGDPAFQDNAFHYLVFMKNSTTCSGGVHVWIDNVKKTLVAVEEDTNIGYFLFNGNRYIGNDATGDRGGFNLDEFSVYNRALSGTEINLKWNSSAGLQYPYPLPSSITLNTNIQDNANLTDNPLVVYFNASVIIYASTGFNCSIYNNITTTQTKTNLDLASNQNFTFTTTNLEEGYYFNITCISSEVTASLKRDIFIDTLAPTFVLTTPANNTQAYRDYNTSLGITALANDTNLYAANFTIWKLNETGGRKAKMYNYFNQSIKDKDKGAFYINYTINNFNTSWNNSRYEIVLTDWDSHTDNVVRDMTLFYSNNLIKADDITFTSADLKTYNSKSNLISYFYLDGDRYKVKLSFNSDSLTHTIRLQTSGALDYIQNSGYKGHFVYFEAGKWIDFEGANIDYVEAEELAPNDWEVTIHLKVSSDEVELESIGDLNTFTASYFFNITNGYSLVNTYSNYVNNSGVNYTNTLKLTYVYKCLPNSSIQFNVSGSLNQTLAVTCDATERTGVLNFQYTTEAAFNTSLNFISNKTINTTGFNNYLRYWYSDLTAPTVVNKTFTLSTGFLTPSVNLSFVCVDNIQPYLYYNMTLNSNIIVLNKFQTNGTKQTNATTNILNGANSFTAYCSDGLQSSTNTTTENAEIRTLYIIDEQKNLAFDTNNLSSVKVFLDDNRTSYDFKTNNRSNISFLSTADVKLRFELIYTSGTIIIRYVDIGLLEDNIRVCANTEGITHYEQILTSSAIRPAILKSVFANCIVAADYTRFAYQDAKVLKAYTYNNLYYLYTFPNDDITQPQIFLAAVDGSIASYINLDTLEFLANSYDIDLVTDMLSISKASNTTMAILYNNTQLDNTALSLAIVRLDTNTVLFNSSSADPNEALILFDFSVLANVNETTVFKVIATATNSAGTNDLIAFFTTGGEVGSQNADVIFIISILLLIFGLSLTASQYTFSWFGLLICIINIGLLASATSAWYITFMLAVNVIIAVFIFLAMTVKNQATIG